VVTPQASFPNTRAAEMAPCCWRMVRRSPKLVVVPVGLVAAAVVGGASAAGSAPPAKLPPSPGWHVGSTRLEYAGCARCVQTESWASTIPYRDPPNQLPPHQTMAVLPRTGIVVHVTRAWEPSPRAWMLRQRPLRVHRAEIHTNFEGNTSGGRVSLLSISTWQAGSYVTVWILFGSPSPSRTTVARAQAELDRVQLAPWNLR